MNGVQVGGDTVLVDITTSNVRRAASRQKHQMPGAFRGLWRGGNRGPDTAGAAA